jgi:endonuclease/exonuclease/phosphatase family metal-dependent hydrolase
MLVALLAFLGAPRGPGPGSWRPGSEEGLLVMTFNIRFGTADDGVNAWPNRRDAVAEIIHRWSPDVLAIQEGLAFQLEELADVLGDYRKLGRHRSGGEEGEFSGLYVHRTRVILGDWGELWLSPTPDSVGSVGWDAALPRMAVWAEVESRPGGHPLRVYGTHFDHRGTEARVESARLLASHARGGPPAVIMGDLNASEESDAMSVFLRQGYRSAVEDLHPGLATGTFNGFRDPAGGPRIDHVLLGPGLEPLLAEILDHRPGGIWPSDHFPVVARVRRSPRAQGPGPLTSRTQRKP